MNFPKFSESIRILKIGRSEVCVWGVAKGRTIKLSISVVIYGWWLVLRFFTTYSVLIFDCLRLWNAVAAVIMPPKRRFNGFFPRVYLKLSYFVENWYPYFLLPYALSLFKSCLILSRRCQRRTPPKCHFNGFFLWR